MWSGGPSCSLHGGSPLFDFGGDLSSRGENFSPGGLLAPDDLEHASVVKADLFADGAQSESVFLGFRERLASSGLGGLLLVLESRLSLAD